MIFAFSVNTFVFEQLFAMEGCTELEIVGTSMLLDERKSNYEALSFNNVDPEIKCGETGVHNMISIVYIGLWFVVLPFIVVLKSPREYIIDYSGYLVKFFMLLVVKKTGD